MSFSIQTRSFLTRVSLDYDNLTLPSEPMPFFGEDLDFTQDAEALAEHFNEKWMSQQREYRDIFFSAAEDDSAQCPFVQNSLCIQQFLGRFEGEVALQALRAPNIEDKGLFKVTLRAVSIV